MAKKYKNFEKIFSKLKRASKIGYKTCATCPWRKFLKNLKIFSFFKKWATGTKKIKILKKYFQNRKMLKKLDIKHVLHKKSIQIPLPGTFKSKRPLQGTFRSKDSTRGLSDRKTPPEVFQIERLHQRSFNRKTAVSCRDDPGCVHSCFYCNIIKIQRLTLTVM